MVNSVELSQIQLSVVVTVYSETFSVIETVERLFKNDRGYLKEILLVIAPKSSNESFRICEALADVHPLVRVYVQKTNPGLGWAYREGMAAAKGNYVGLMSGDLETEPEAIDRMVRKIEETACDGVIANRWLSRNGFRNYDKLKLVLNWLFQRIFKLLYATSLGDLTYGFKILKQEIAKGIQWEGTLHEIAIETTLKPLKSGYYLEQVPSVWIGRTEGESKNTFARNFRYVWIALKILVSPPNHL